VWAGDQVLWELRAPGADGNDLESTTSAGASEPRFYGRVSYLHAGGIDRPLSIWKDGVGSVRPHENWRGQFARGTWGAGVRVLQPYRASRTCSRQYEARRPAESLRGPSSSS
jgi:hypothetical protein